MKAELKQRIRGRYSFCIIIVLLVVATIAIRLYINTVVDAHHWNEKANKMAMNEIATEPVRGCILADDSTVLAGNTIMFHIAVDIQSLSRVKKDSLEKYMPQFCDSLSRVLSEKSKAQWMEFFKGHLKREHKKASVRLSKQLFTDHELMRIKRFPFSCHTRRKVLSWEEEIIRYKPYGKLASRSIGNVAKDEDKRTHGTSGLERALDSLLYGTNGQATATQMTNGFKRIETTPSVPGYNVETTIDVRIQSILEDELSAACEEFQPEWATAIIMERESGEIKAISNLERNDEGTYYEGQNRAVQRFEPGSVVKPISMLIALEKGAVKGLDEPISQGGLRWVCYSSVISDTHIVPNMTVRKVIEHSSNIGMAKIIMRKYADNPAWFKKDLKEIGFFDPLNIGIAGERTPRYPDLKNNNEGRVNLSRMCFGYTTEIPPVYTMAMYNAIANGGIFVTPHLVKRLVRSDAKGEILVDSVVQVKRHRVCSEKSAKMLCEMLKGVVWNGGTGKCLQDDQVSISGKTGTCRIFEDGAYQALYRLAFCGFFPSDNPKYSAMVLMSKPNIRGAAASSGKVMLHVAQKLYSRGLLNNYSDYHKEKGNERKATLYATSDQKSRSEARKTLGIKGSNVYNVKNDNNKNIGVVPSVIGMGLRDAIFLLESKGINVTFEGHGFVVSQNIKAGTRVKRAETVHLILRTKI